MRDQAVQQAPAIVVLPGEIDVSNAQGVFDQLSSVFAAGATVVVADLTATVFCDSTGLSTLLKVQRQAAAGGAQLRLAISPGGPVQRVFDLMAFDRLLPIYTSRAQATAST
jgi:anti-sigma B factor antagonist